MTALLPPDWSERYRAWVQEATPLLAAKQWGPGFAGYPYPQITNTPWTAPGRPLHTARLALITSGGLYLPGEQEPFDEPNPHGDTTYRLLPSDLQGRRWDVAHGHYDPAGARADYNTVLPLDIAHALVQEGVIGSVAPTAYSFMGFQTDSAAFLSGTAPAIAAQMRKEGVDVALLVPV